MQLFPVVPELLKELQKVVGVFKALGFLHRIISVISALTAEIDGGKPVDRHIGALIDRHEAHHLLLRYVRFENRLAPDPVRALFRDSFLCQLVAELYFELGAVQTAFS